MVYEILMPDFGGGITEAAILEWKKKPGESLNAGDAVCEVEAEKAVEDILSPGEGILRLVFAEEGDSLATGTLLAVVADAEEDLAAYQQK